MPVIKTYGGDLPYQAGYKSGRTARKIYEDEKRRQDAKYAAELEFNERKLNAEREIQELNIIRQKELDVQNQLNWEADLQVRKESNQALSDYRSLLANYKQVDSEIKAKKDAETAKRLADKDMISLNTKAITLAQNENKFATPEVPTINKYKDLITGKAQQQPKQEKILVIAPDGTKGYLNVDEADVFLRTIKGSRRG